MAAPEAIAMDDWRIKYEAQEIARAIAAMIAEQRAHGASDDDIAALVKLMGDDQESEAEIQTMHRRRRRDDHHQQPGSRFSWGREATEACGLRELVPVA